jgi:hypothetical protein
MPKVTGTLSLVKLDLKAAGAALDKELTELLKAGIRAWVEKATDVIPLWSGAARSVFSEIGDAVGVSFNTSPVSRRWRVPDRRAMGRASSEFEISTTGPIYQFKHSHDLFHLRINEVVNVHDHGFKPNLIQPGPYNWRVQAKRAYENVVDPRLKNLNFDVARYVKYTQVRVG